MLTKLKLPKFLAFKQEYHGKTNELKTNIQIGLPFILDPANVGAKKFFPHSAIWDTGATSSVISTKIVSEINLKPLGMIEVATAGGIITTNTHLVDFLLPNHVHIPNVRVTGSEHLNSCDVLIGMDIITLGDFAIANANGKTHFSYCIPSHDRPVCLFEKSEKVNKR